MISERLRYSLHLEQDYLLEHPECDNVEVFFPFYETSRSIYFISRFGCSVMRFDKFKKRFRSCKIRIALCPAMKKSGRPAYMEFNVHGVYFKIHKTIAELFVDNQNLFATDVDHLNGDILCNNAFNLEWVTREENTRRKMVAWYTKHNRPVPQRYQTVANYMSYLNSKNHAVSTKRS